MERQSKLLRHLDDYSGWLALAITLVCVLCLAFGHA